MEYPGWSTLVHQMRTLLHGRHSRRTNYAHRVVLQCECLEERIVLDDESAGPDGIDARGLGLTGHGVHIGQVEGGRPGLRNQPDNNVNSHPDVIPTEVFQQQFAAVPNKDVNSGQFHATQVAGVMIGTGNTNKGVAPDAHLYASAARFIDMTDYTRLLWSAQHIASRNDDDIPAINMSFGLKPKDGQALDGQSLASQGIDYFARYHDTLFVKSLPNDTENSVIPGDAFNVLTVSAARQGIAGGKFRRVVTPPAVLANGRRLVHLMAPGDRILVPTPGVANYDSRSGTSFAAPHATGTVALLQQDARFVQPQGPDATRHQVMKAILMNSTDKVEGRISMSRTVLKRDGKDTWDQSDARDDPKTNDPGGRMEPLDKEMGTGFLNARRAQTQLRGGQFAPQNPNTGVIGWDYRGISDQGSIAKYTIPRLKGGSWISITLTWDRYVTLQEVAPGDDRWSWKDTFNSQPLSNLDLFLMPAGAANVNQNLWSSESTLYNVEHIFFHLPAGNAAYEIWVRQTSNDGTNYALAWWAEAAPAAQPGKVGEKVWHDLNSNGIQDASEPALENVKVEVYTSAGTLVDSTTTDYDGKYIFELSPGSYYIRVTAPYAMGFTTKDAGSDDTLDSDTNLSGQTDVFTVGLSEDFTIDSGLVSLPYGSIGDRLWNDANNNGIQDSGEFGVSDVEVTLYDSSGNHVRTTSTDSSGYYSFTLVAPGSYYVAFGAAPNYGFSPKDQGSDDTVDSDANLNGQTDIFSLALQENKTGIDAGLVLIGGTVGDYVWFDANQNGVQDWDEFGFSGITVKLYTFSGSLVATTTTDDDGYYSFPSITPGNYYIVVQAPFDYGFTSKDVGANDAIDSDVNSSGQTNVFALALGDDKTDVDAGLVSLYYASVGNFVWHDANNNGIQDSGESGLSDVEVGLYTSAGILIGITATNASGFYWFGALDPGNYYLVFTAPSGYSFSPKDQGSNDMVDSDADPITGATDTFTLAGGQYDSSRDAGLVVGDPVILGLSQSSGPTIGGTIVNISGVNFRHVTSVLFGNAPAIFTVLSPTQIRATAPARPIGTVDVRVGNPRGISAIVLAGRFTYTLLPPPPPPPAPPSAADFPSEELSSGSDGLPDEDLAAVGMLLSGEEEGDFVGESTDGGFSTGGQAFAEPVPDPLDPSSIDDFLGTLPVTELAKKDGINLDDSLKKLDLDAILAPAGNGPVWVIDGYAAP